MLVINQDDIEFFLSNFNEKRQRNNAKYSQKDKV